MRKRWLAFVASAFLVVVPAGVLIVASGNEPSVASSLEANIAVLDRAPEESLRLPAGLEVAGYDTASARKAFALPDGASVVAVRRTDTRISFGEMVCVLNVASEFAASGSCARVEQFNRGGVTGVEGTVPNTTIVGLVPDGVAEVRITFSDGSSQTVLVKNNAFALQSKQAANTVEFEGPDGIVVREVTPFRG